jgi:feruloyl esterase
MRERQSDGVWLTGLLTAALIACAANPAAGATCESLASLALPNAAITASESITAGAFAPPAAGRGAAPITGLPSFCRVVAKLTPTADSDITIEVWLPAAGWNGKFQAVGNGGWAGSINYAAMADALKRGYVASSTDSGHQGAGGPWMRNVQKLIDFGYRSVHEIAIKGKAITEAFYGNQPKLSYFNGCSGGGRQGLIAAQRFPDDFDGIVAGAPALNTTGRAAFAMWIAQNLHKDEARFIPPAKYPAIHDAVLQACDMLDGVKDRVIENPKACRFDPKVLQCKGEDAATCLTAPQVEAARTMYAPLVNPVTKKEIFPGLAYGSELGWSTFGGPRPFGIGAEMFEHMVFNDPDWDFKTLNFDTHMDLVDKIENGVINARDPNLKPFAAAGGKLIQYHGWADPQISAGSSVLYYESVTAAMGGAAQVGSYYRLFMVPGMNHCGGGDGTATFDMLTALEQWVEGGKAPDRIPASRMANGKVDRTRPLCPYPQQATYRGSGSTDEAESFVCK